MCSCVVKSLRFSSCAFFLSVVLVVGVDLTPTSNPSSTSAKTASIPLLIVV
eukprot:m.134497 g.134497  ORF g.134497 m.134497 type:complete len:51 (+) comp15824_c0_seq2:4010-4162(+)